MATNQTINRIIFNVMRGLLVIINASYTALFGATYGAAMFALPTPLLSVTAGAVAHLILFDISALGWFLARSQSNTSTTQRALATILAVLSIGGSILASITHLATTTTLVDLSASRPAISMVAFIAITAMAALHFAGLFLWVYFDPNYVAHDSELERAARLVQFRQDKQNAMLGVVMANVDNEYNAQLAGLAQNEATRIWADMQNQLALPNGQPAQPGARWVVAINGVDVFTGTNEQHARAVMAGAIRTGAAVILKCNGRVVESTNGQPAAAAPTNGHAGK